VFFIHLKIGDVMSLEDKLAENTAALVALTAAIKAGLSAPKTEFPSIFASKLVAAHGVPEAQTDDEPKEEPAPKPLKAKDAIAAKNKERKEKLAEIEAKPLSERTNNDLLKQVLAEAEAEGVEVEELPDLHPGERRTPEYYDTNVKPAVIAACSVDKPAAKAFLAAFTYQTDNGPVTGLANAKDAPSIYWDAIILGMNAIANPHVPEEDDLA
jgi:hypothetical protein